jgi:hypothetical protein
LGEKEDLIATAAAETAQSVPDRLALVDLALNLPPLVLPKFGQYELQLYANDVYLARAVLTVREERG